MTTRQKACIATVVVIALALVGLFVARAFGPPVIVTLARYQPGDSNAVVQIVNRTGPGEYYCGGLSIGRLSLGLHPGVRGIIARNERLTVSVPVLENTRSISVSFDPARSAIRQRIEAALGIEPGLSANLALPTSPAPSP